MSDSNYFGNLVVTSLLTNAAKYLAIFTVNPDFLTGAGGTEATGGSYARKQCDFDAPTNQVTQNTDELIWALGTDIAAGTYTGWAIYDAASGGNFIFGKAFSANRILAISGDKITFPAGSIIRNPTA